MAMNAPKLGTIVRSPEKERDWVKEAVLLPILLEVIQRDLDKLTRSSVTLSLPNIVVLQRLLENVRKDVVAIRKTLAAAGIRIFDETRDANGVRCRFVSSGRSDRLQFSRDRVKADISIMAGMYVESR